MSDHERGAYTPPTDAPLAFEARRPVRGASPFPMTLAASLLVLIGLAAAIFVFYRSGVRQANQPPQSVGQPVGALKQAAPPDSQPQDAAQGLQIYRAEAGQPPQQAAAQPQFTPPPEQPAPRPPVASTPPPAAAPTTPIVSAAAPALRPAQDVPPPVAARPSRFAEAKPAARPVQPPPEKAAPARPARQKPAAEKVAEKLPAKPPAAAAESAGAKGGAAVQIGAVASPQLADRTWNEAVDAAPGLAAGKGKGVETVQKDGKTLYRTSVTGFASRAEAQAFCARLKAAGKACFVK